MVRKLLETFGSKKKHSKNFFIFLESNYAYARGPGTKTISFDEFDITREAQLEFCYYRYSFNYYLLVII